MAFRLSAQLRRLRPSSRVQRIILVSFLAVLAGGLAVLAAAWGRACAGNTCPSIAELGGYDPNQASKVYAADGRLITDLGLERRTVVPLGEMSPVVKAAFILADSQSASRDAIIRSRRRSFALSLMSSPVLRA